MQTFELNKVRGLGEKIEFTFAFWKAHFKLLFKLALTICVPYIVLGTVISSIASLYLIDESGVMSSVNFLGSLLSGIGMIFLSTLAYSFLKVQNDPNQELTEGNIKFEVRKNSGVVFKGSFVYGICIILGTLVFLIPGLYIGIAWSILIPIMVIEDLETGDSISRAQKLIKGRWWSTFAFLFVLGLVAGLVNLILGQAPAVIAGILTVVSIEDGGGVSTMTGVIIISLTIVSGFISPIFSILMQLGTGVQYFSLKEEKEATSIMNEVESMA